MFQEAQKHRADELNAANRDARPSRSKNPESDMPFTWLTDEKIFAIF